jgi:hypothetical protein
VDQCYARAGAAPRGSREAANAIAPTHTAPAASSSVAHAERVAPVVTTSSTRTTRAGGGWTTRTRGGEANRSLRERPTCRAPWRRRRQRATGIPARRPISLANRSAGSKPRQARRSGSAGTGTRVPSRSPRGASATVRLAMSAATGSRRLNLIAATSSLATPSYGRAAQARSSERRRRSRPRPSSSSAPHARQSEESVARLQAQQVGGTMRLAAAASVAPFRRIPTKRREAWDTPPLSRLIGAYRQ